MHKDEKLLIEAYTAMTEKAEHCKYAVDGCECGECVECSEHKANKSKDLTGDGKVDSEDYLKAKDLAIKKARFKSKEKKNKKSVKESFVPSQSLTKFEEAYKDILEWFE